MRRELERIPAAEIAHVCARSVDCLHVRAVRPRQFSCPGLWRRIAEGMHALRRSASSSCKYAADGVCGKISRERVRGRSGSVRLRIACVHYISPILCRGVGAWCVLQWDRSRVHVRTPLSTTRTPHVCALPFGGILT